MTKETIYVRLYRSTDGNKLLAQVPYQYRKAVKVAGARWSRPLRAWWWPMAEFEDAVDTMKAKGIKVTGPPDLAARIKQRDLDAADADAIRSGLISSSFKKTDPYGDLPPYLYDHQKRAVRLAERFEQYGFFMDTGTGKTAVGIEILKRLRKGKRGLVVAPLSIIRSAWGTDLD